MHCKTHCKMHFVAIYLIKRREMYEYFEFDAEDLSYEWDEEKDHLNFAKHGIHFKTAVKVFLDPNKMIREDEEHLGEKRYNILGRVGKILFVVCTFREKNIVRMISARIASIPERERYENGEYEI